MSSKTKLMYYNALSFKIHGYFMFQHFIVTRFNLRDPKLIAQGDTSLLHDIWMENRLELFENYCFSSLKAQIEQNFTWLVFFDTSTPERFRKEITRFEAEFSPFTPIFIDGMDAFLPSIKAEIATRLTEPYVITSRLDNDDSLHQNCTQEVQAQFAQQNFMAIDFVDGYTLQIEPEVRLGKRAHVHNPFIHLIEKSENFVTVWSRSRHGHWSKVKQVKPIRNKRMWMSVIHVENKTNLFYGFGDIDWQEIQAFNLKGDLAKQLQAKRAPFNSWKKQSIKHQFKTLWKANFKLLKRKFS
tara:strand:+ start:206 stop:1099 length:894 start_codon:yes stop_codon:yes gene_type:complete